MTLQNVSPIDVVRRPKYAMHKKSRLLPSCLNLMSCHKLHRDDIW